jgi:aldehyde dehydrogenase
LRARYENYIGGRWVAPAKSGYFDNISPITGQVVCQVAVVPDDLENMYQGCIDGICLFDPWD